MRAFPTDLNTPDLLPFVLFGDLSLQRLIDIAESPIYLQYLSGTSHETRPQTYASCNNYKRPVMPSAPKALYNGRMVLA